MKFLITSLCLSTALFASDDKFYLSPGSLLMDQNGLYVDLDGQLFPVTAVRSDEMGVYVDDWEIKWDCLECKKPNLLWFSFCAWCGKPRPKTAG